MSQTFSNKIDLADIFQKIDYIAILRMSPDFPNYVAGSDIDILCGAGGYTIEDLNRMLPLTRIDKGPGWVQLDYRVNEKLDLKFDLYNSIISDDFRDDLMIASTCIEVDNHWYYVPSEEFDGMLKCREYLKYPMRKQKYKEFVKYKERLDEYTNLSKTTKTF